jgi:hypothetical protein
VVKYNGAAFVVLHHSGWDEIRERGSTAIRDNSDIVIQITEWNPRAGRIMLKHQKRREGVPLQEFGYGLKLVSVPGYRQPVPICTVGRLDAGYAVLGGVPPEYGHAAKIVEIVVKLFSKGARTEELNRQFQEETKLKRQTFYNGLNCAIEKGWIVGNGPYNLNPNKCWMEVVQKPLHSTAPPKGAQSGWTSPMDSNWSSGQSESCNNGDATGSAQKPNENNKPESSVDPSKMTDLEREIWDQLKGKDDPGSAPDTKH